MATTLAALTHEDLCRAREDGSRYELIEGELVLVAAPSPLHRRVTQRIWKHFDNALGEGEAGQAYISPVDVRFLDGSVVQPDVVVVLPDRAAIVMDTLIEGASNLIGEIASRSTRGRDRGAKLQLYARHGVPEYWYVEADTRSITGCTEPMNTGYRRTGRETIRIEAATVAGLGPGPDLDLDDRFWS